MKLTFTIRHAIASKRNLLGRQDPILFLFRANSAITHNDPSTDLPPQYLLAHMNYARLRAPLDHPTMSEFLLAIGPINALARATPGFYWSFDNDVPCERDPVEMLRHDARLMPQLSLWRDLESLQHFAFKSGHAMYVKRRKEWFSPIESPYAVCWWRPHDSPMPTLKEAFDRLQHLKDHGPSEVAFDFASAKSFPPPPMKSGDDCVQ